MHRVRQAIAHAATPWDWRTRGRVVLLVAVAAALTLYAIVSGLIDGWSIPNTILLVGWRGGLCVLLLLWPSVRSLRRWDAEHESAEAPSGV